MASYRRGEGDQPLFLYFEQYTVPAPFNSDLRCAAHYQASGKPENAQVLATLWGGGYHSRVLIGCSGAQSYDAARVFARC